MKSINIDLLKLYPTIKSTNQSKDIVNFLYYKLANENCSMNTIKSYAWILTNFALFLDTKSKNLDDIEKKDLDEWLSKFSKKTTKNQRLSCIKAFSGYLSDNELISQNLQNICRKTKFLKISTQESPVTAQDLLTPSEFQKMVDSCTNNRDILLLYMYLTSGARAADPLKLRVSDIIVDEHITKSIQMKGDKKGYLLFSSQTIDLFKEYVKEKQLRPEDKIFNLSYDGLYYIIKKLAKKANITKNVYPHLFRSMFSSIFLSQTGGDIKALQIAGNWSNIQMPARYAKLNIDHIKEMHSKLNFNLSGDKNADNRRKDG